MEPNVDGLYNEQEHEYWEAWRAMRSLYPFAFKDIKFVAFCKWLDEAVEEHTCGTS